VEEDEKIFQGTGNGEDRGVCLLHKRGDSTRYEKHRGSRVNFPGLSVTRTGKKKGCRFSKLHKERVNKVYPGKVKATQG